MQIEAMVGELDITNIQIGQIVRFTLESLPGRTFLGEVETLRLTPVITNNVVSYPVIIKVENLDGSLLPGMTCAIDFIVDHSRNILMVPNTALRFQPTNLSEERIAEMVFNASLENMSNEQRQFAVQTREASIQNANLSTNGALTNLMMGGGQNVNMMGMGNPGGNRQPGMGQGQRPAQNRDSAPVMRNLWFINDDGQLEVIQVQTGISSGSFTEIRVPDDFEGKQIIIRERI
jgi:HlyD family secretion protein